MVKTDDDIWIFYRIGKENLLPIHMSTRYVIRTFEWNTSKLRYNWFRTKSTNWTHITHWPVRRLTRSFAFATHPPISCGREKCAARTRTSQLKFKCSTSHDKLLPFIIHSARLGRVWKGSSDNKRSSIISDPSKLNDNQTKTYERQWMTAHCRKHYPRSSNRSIESCVLHNWKARLNHSFVT